MKNESPILQIQQYGHIHVKLKELLEEKNLTRGAVARLINTRFEVIDKWCNGTIDKIDGDILARLCCVLSCTVGDILEYRD